MYLQWICITEIMSYCDVLEPSHVLKVEGDSVTSDEGPGDLLPFLQKLSKFLMRGGKAI